MERAKLGLNIPYREKLNNEEKECYHGKIADIGLDPYEHAYSSCTVKMAPSSEQLMLTPPFRILAHTIAHSISSALWRPPQE